MLRFAIILVHLAEFLMKIITIIITAIFIDHTHLQAQISLSGFGSTGAVRMDVDAQKINKFAKQAAHEKVASARNASALGSCVSWAVGRQEEKVGTQKHLK